MLHASFTIENILQWILITCINYMAVRGVRARVDKQKDREYTEEIDIFQLF